MMDVSYRPYRPEDAADTKRIIDEAFMVHRYVNDPRLLNGALEVYLRERLVASTYAQVGVRAGRVVGVIMGQVVGQRRLPGRWRNRAAIAAHAAGLAVRGFKERRSLTQYLAFGGHYRALRGQTRAPLTDELTLFAVDSSARGLGVGTALYQGFAAQLREHNRTDFYLYTDSQCTYGFYEKRGMDRAAAKDVRIFLDGKPDTLSVYLYTGATPPS